MVVIALVGARWDRRNGGPRCWCPFPMCHGGARNAHRTHVDVGESMIGGCFFVPWRFVKVSGGSYSL